MTITFDGIEATGYPVALTCAPGTHKLAVSSPDHESYEATITLAAGETTSTVELALTPLETYRRFIDAGTFHHYDIEYQYIHPDERKLLTLEHWSELGAQTQMKSVTFGDVRMLDQWTSTFTGTTYADVAEIDRKIELQVIDPQYSDYGQVLTDGACQHWVKVEGIWYLVHQDKL